MNILETATILVVDDDIALAHLMCGILKRAGCTCTIAESADEARELLARDGFDLVLADMNMPGDSGLQLIAEVLQKHQDVAAIMITGVDDTELADEATHLGAYGYLIKPVSESELVINVTNALRRRALEIENRGHRERLTETVKERTTELWKVIQELERSDKDLRKSQEQTIARLAIAAEFRDNETARHIHRMSRYCHLLAREAGESEERAEAIRIASVMHDVGKIGVPDSILLKPGRFTPEEYEIMKQHAEMGFQILSGTGTHLLDLAATIALTHHEKMDGSGYPRGLRGEDIPIEGRIAAVADIFDALTTNRIYRKAYPIGETLEIMKEYQGHKLDATLLDLFLDKLPEVLTIQEEEAAA